MKNKPQPKAPSSIPNHILLLQMNPYSKLNLMFKLQKKVLQNLKALVINNIQPGVFDPFVTPIKGAADKTFLDFEIVIAVLPP